VWSLRDWAHLGAIREARRQDERYRRWTEKWFDLCGEWSQSFLIPVPYSPLH
jgi:hypothetical protein